MIFYFIMKSGKPNSLKHDPSQMEVSRFKSILSKELSVNEEDLILIANGGLCIQDGLIGNYNCADNKENPVFVYLRHRKGIPNEMVEENLLKLEYQTNCDKLRSIIIKPGSNISLLLENEAITVVLVDSSRRIFDRLDWEIRNQFLLFEGWSAALANLTDSLTAVEKRIEAMNANLERFRCSELELGFNMMADLAASKAGLEAVPILPQLLCDSTETQDGDTSYPTNLLQWILSQDNRTRPKVTIQSLILEAQQAYNDLFGIPNESEVSLSYLKDNWGKIGLIGTAYKNMEIGKGLVCDNKPTQILIDEEAEENEKTMVEKETHTSTKSFLKRLDYLTGVRERSEKASNLIQTHKEYMEHTVRQCRDSGGQIVLSDHCSSAKSQLENILKQYTYLWENLGLVERSKLDLTKNIDSRKNWLQQFQTKICEIDDSIFLVKEQIKRVRTGLRVLEQMCTAPLVYMKGIAEISRRQHYLDIWYDWGIKCSKLARQIRQKDRKARMELEKDFENHFIQTLFNSLYSFSLPKLGTSLLETKRQILPTITDADIEKLTNHLPEFSSILSFERINPETLVTDLTPDESGRENEQLIKSLPIELPSIDLYNGVSLLPVPDDLNMQIDELCLSQPDQRVSDPVICSDQLSNDSSKMVKSIDSMDFQLTNHTATETNRDIVCVPRSLLDSFSSTIKDLQTELNSTKLVLENQLKEHSLSFKKIMNLATNLTEKVDSCSKVISTSSTSSDRFQYMSKSSEFEAPTRNLSNSLQLSHKEFIKGDTVCFFSYWVNNALQWRMITTDNRIYFLHDDSFNTPSAPTRQRRTSTNCQRPTESSVIDCSAMSQSQLSPDINNIKSMPLVPQIVRGIYLSREEYICKKTTNRYGLPLNTKFFRVQASIDWISGRSTN